MVNDAQFLIKEMCVITKKSMQTENRQTPLHAVHAPLRIYRPTHVNRNDELMEEGDALVSAFVANLPKLMISPPNIVIAVVVARALLSALQKAMYSTSFGHRTAHESRIEELPHIEVPQKVRQIGLTKIASVGAVRYQHAETG